MTIAKYGVLIGSVMVLAAQVANAQLDVGNNADACTQIDGLRKGNKLSEARDAARTCLEALEAEVNGAAGKFFLPEIAGWKRTNIEQNQALGFTNITGTYAKDNNTATVSLTGGSGGGGALGGLLGGFAKLGVQSSGKQVKVAGLPANVGPGRRDHRDAQRRLVLGFLVAGLPRSGCRSRRHRRPRERVPGGGYQQDAAVVGELALGAPEPLLQALPVQVVVLLEQLGLEREARRAGSRAASRK